MDGSRPLRADWPLKALGLACLYPTMGAAAVPSSYHYECHHAFPTSGYGGGSSEGPRCSEKQIFSSLGCLHCVFWPHR